VFYYLASSDFGNAEDLAEGFQDEFKLVFAPLVSDQILSFATFVTNLGSSTDVATHGTDIEGEATGALLSPWQCLTFREATGDRRAPYGWKRFGYVTEAMNAAEGALDGAFAGAAVDMNSFLSSPITPGSVTYTPVLTSKANETHDEDLVLPLVSAIFQKIGHADGRKTY
jgi:hypothetical protein